MYKDSPRAAGRRDSHGHGPMIVPDNSPHIVQDFTCSQVADDIGVPAGYSDYGKSPFLGGYLYDLLRINVYDTYMRMET